MPSTGGSDKHVSPGATDGQGSTTGSSKVTKSGSMKVKRTQSAAKILTKSKSSGSLKKKAGDQPSSASSSAAKPGRDGHRSSSTSGETDLLVPKQNGSLRRGGEEEFGEEEDELWEVGEEKKEPSIKGLWKKAFKSMKSPGSDSKWLNRASFKRRDSKYDVDEAEEEEPKEIDPVYSLLKCAADLPKMARSQNREGQLLPCQGPHCMARASSPAPPGVSQSSRSSLSGSLCMNCRGHHPSTDPSSPRRASPHSLGQDFKQFYKQTSPVKRLSSSSAELGV